MPAGMRLTRLPTARTPRVLWVTIVETVTSKQLALSAWRADTLLTNEKIPDRSQHVSKERDSSIRVRGCR